jgi:acyl-CoA synthetase (AMP-forming)/AMP-acid ligase II
VSNAVVAPLDPSLTAHEAAATLARLAPRLLLVPPGTDGCIAAVARRLGIPVVDTERLEVGGTGPAAQTLATPEPESPAMLVETSGTTGRPKLIRITHGQLAASAANLARFLRFSPVDRSLDVMALFNIGGSISSLLLPLHAGSSVVCPPSLDERLVADEIVRHRPTWYTAAPALHELVLAAVRRAGRAPFRFARSTSAPLPRRLLAELEGAYGVPVLDAYGLSEAAGQVSSNPLPPGRRKPGTVGPPAGCEVRILDETGEVLIRGSQVIRGYAGGTAEPGDTIDGWLRTGDVGYLDEDGYLVLAGRVKEVINRGGEKIAPAEVEEVLLAHPAVQEAAVFPVPHPTLGEDGAAAIVLAEGAEPLEAAELRRFAAERLSAPKVPRRVSFVDELPRTALGKVPRRRLAEALGVGSAPSG